MKLPKFISENLLLKMTSLNAVVIFIRLAITVVIQRIITDLLGATGHAKIGNLRNLMAMLTSFSTVGVFNGIVKYVSEFEKDKKEIQKIFSTVFVFISIAILITSLVLFFSASLLSTTIFGSTSFVFIFKILALIVPAIALHRTLNGIINGLSAYKKFVKIELFGYLLSSGLLTFCLYNYSLKGVLFAIAVTPVIQLGILLFIFGSVIKDFLNLKKVEFKIPYAKQLLAFTLMSFVSTILINYIEIDIRGMITKKITETDAGYWTTMTNISKNYMVFSASLFTLYVIPKFSSINTGKEFKTEVLHIYKTLLPIFGIGMLVIYLFRNTIIDYVYPSFSGMEPLFKWQLIGDFIRLASLVLGHQFLAKKMVRNYIFAELLSLSLFFGLSYYFIAIYALEGIVIAHLVRSILMFFVILFLILRFFKQHNKIVKK